MKLRYFSFLFIASISLLVLQSVSSGRAANGGQDRTGSPGALSTTCIACHSSAGSFSNPQLGITVKDNNGNSVSSYTAGETYTLEFQVSSNGSPAGYAMQAVVLDASNSNTGDLSSASTSNTQLATISNGREFIEHLGRSSTGFFSCSWTAPTTGTGTVSIYGVGMAVNGVSTSGDNTSPSTQFDLSENVSTAVESVVSDATYSVYPMPNKGHFNLRNNQTAGNSTIRVINLQGQELFQQRSFLEQNASLNIQIDDLANGLYFVQIEKSGELESIPMFIKK